LVKSKFPTTYNPNQEFTNLFNTEDYSYHMTIHRQNDSLISRIFDTKTSKVHYFNIEKAETLNLKYLYTEAIKTFPNDYSYEFSDIKEKDGVKAVVFKVLNKRKIAVAKYHLNIKETEENNFSVYQLSTLETLLFADIIPPYNFIVLKSKGRNTSGNHTSYELKSIEIVNFVVTIP